MKKNIFTIIFLISIILNNSLQAQEKDEYLKLGLLIPLSGKNAAVGKSILFSIQMALEEIDDKNVIIIPKDIGDGDEKNLEKAIMEIKDLGLDAIIGPLRQSNFKTAFKFKNLVFVSPSNFQSEIQNNVISIGINLESQLLAIQKFLLKEKKTKTVLLYPDDKNSQYIEQELRKYNFKVNKKFKYTPSQEVLTGQLEKLTNYNQRKKNLEIRKKVLEKKDDIKSKRELEYLEQKYTLGKVNFDSIIILDFGNNLKSVISTLIFQDVNQNDVVFTTLNQWFDVSLFNENSLKTLYFPSVNYRNYLNFKKSYKKNFDLDTQEIALLTYDALGLIYYVWRNNDKKITVNDFNFKKNVKGKIGNFKLQNRKIIQELEMYKTDSGKFKKY